MYIAIGSFEERFFETLDDCFLSRCVEETTFYKGLDDHIGSLIDLVITDSKKRVLDMINQAALGSLSRCHSVLKWKFVVGRMNNEVFRPLRKWFNGNYIGMSNEISETNWDKLFYCQNADFCYLLFVEKFRQLCEKYVPESKTLFRPGRQ